MSNLPIKSKEKKLNILQKLRLTLFKAQKFTMEKYINAPEYIKTNDMVIGKIIDNEDMCTEENMLQIPQYKLEEILEASTLIKKFSLEKQIEFIKAEGSLPVIYTEEERFTLMDEALKIGQPDLCSFLKENEQSNYLILLKENGTLENNLPKVLKYLNNEIKGTLIKEKNDLLIYLDINEQLEYVQKEPKYFKYVDENTQLMYIQKKPEYIKFASDTIQEKVTLLDKNNFKKTSKEFQLKTIQKHPNAYNFASDIIKSEIFKNSRDPMYALALRSLLHKDIMYSKHIYISNMLEGVEGVNKPILDIFKDINQESPEMIKKMFLNSRLMGAKGKLLSSSTVLHGALGEKAPVGIDDYIPEQIKIVQSLTVDQIKELVEIDSNYILPYLTGTKIQIMTPEEIASSKDRCNKLFISMFGEEKFNSLENCINSIYKMQLIEQDSLKESIPGLHKGKENYGSMNMATLRSVDNIPLDHMKILFDKNIISSNSNESIKQYFEKLQEGKETFDSFKLLIENAYGKQAKEILDSRPELNVHTINSLESFDKRIFDNFGLGFTHDLLSYNIRDFSSFLSVVKDEAKLEDFKTYYNVLSKIMGANVETMQKAISEFKYNEELLKNVRSTELTDKQSENLISVLCSKNNLYEINTLQDLDNYQEIANQKTKEDLSNAYSEYLSRMEKGKSVETACMPIKECICQNYLGLDYYYNDYGDSFLYLTNMYDLQSEKSKSDMYTEFELKIFEVLEFIEHENNVNKLMDFSNALMEQETIRNPVLLYTAIEKMKQHELEIFNDSLLSVDKMEELCELEQGKENPLIIKETIDGVPKYTLQGIPFNILLHDPNGMNLTDYLNYDGQLGNNAICSRNISDKIVAEGNWGKFGYTSIETTSGMIANSTNDANTDHNAKLVRGSGIISKKVNENTSFFGSETSFYRRFRSHDKITNKNHGGKRVPDVIVEYHKVTKYSKEYLDKLKKYNISIVYIDKAKYKDLQQNKEKQEGQENINTEGR